MDPQTSDDAADCPPWCVGDDDRNQDSDGRPLHTSEWDGPARHDDGRGWHVLARTVRRHGAAETAAVQLAVYVDGNEAVVTLPPSLADEVTAAIEGAAEDARAAS